MADFFAMGGYAGFVWSSYAVVGLVMLGLVFVIWRDLRRQKALLAVLEKLNADGSRKRAPMKNAGNATEPSA
tara:strand:- start:41836 stop:42051 length:216 start_codon:yes stop_codon:yes gene_type:complete